MTAEKDMQQLAADAPRARSGLDAGALDVWIRRALAERFDATLDETLPAEMTLLLNGLH